MSRRDKILSMVISKSETSSSQPTPNTKHETIEKPINKKTQISTKIDEIWSRSLDFNDFKPVFDFRNEYSNSVQLVKSYDLSAFKSRARERTPPFTRHSLMCYENLPSSDEDNCNNTKTPDAFKQPYDSDDSAMDKDYCPDNCTDSDSDSDTSEKKQRRVKNIVITAEVHDECHVLSKDSHGNIYDSKTPNPRKEEHTYDTNNESEQMNNIIVLETNITVERAENEPLPILSDDNIETITEQVQTENERGENIESLSTLHENEKGITKSGLPRKRRKFDVPLAERLKLKKETEDEKLSLKPPCDEKCRKKCTTKFTEEIRRGIHDRYVNLNWESRGLFIKGVVEPHQVKRRVTKENEEPSKRNVSYRYHLFNKNEKIEVCKTYFLTTLGYNSQNNTHVHLALNKEIDQQKDKRGSFERKNVIDKNIIKEHIESFNPTISHYRREHAPNKRYLPSDLSIKMMYECFKEKYPDMVLSVETYRKVVKDMNISFAHLGNEECEQCALFKSHNENACTQEECESCIQQKKHKLRYTETRTEYQNDKDLASTDNQSVYYSVDLQKVIMLPRMDQFKRCIFCPRIITFNESFVPLGKSIGNNVPYAVLWNETVSGRSQEDIISAYRSFLIQKRDVNHIVLWADNCSAQNKNWAFICFLVNIVNSPLIAAQSITVKYFEPGHTFMSADNFHAQVEKSFKKKGKIYDFDDFVDAVKLANSKNNVAKVMSVSDFYCYEDFSSQHKIRNIEPRVYLKDIMAIQAERGAFTIKYKASHVEDYKELDFLQLKVVKTKSFPNTANKSNCRGITKERKDKIVSDLVPLMPLTRRNFWIHLPVSAKVPNIT